MEFVYNGLSEWIVYFFLSLVIHINIGENLRTNKKKHEDKSEKIAAIKTRGS